MLPHGQSGQFQVAALLGHANQREVGRASAHVAHKQQVADLDLRSPGVAHRGQPRIEGRLRLLQQGHVDQARGPRGFDGQVAGRRVERRGDREQDLLLSQAIVRRFAELGIPGVAQVGQIGNAGLDGRHFLHVRRGVPGQDGGLAIGPRMREPALGRPDHASGDLGPMVAGERADDVVGLGLPAEVDRARRELLLGREIEEGRQRGAFADLARRDDLRDRQRMNGGNPAIHGLAGIGVGEGAVGGPKVDTYHIAGHGCSWRSPRLCNFHLGRRQDREVVASPGHDRQMDRLHPPAVMLEHPLEWR